MTKTELEALIDSGDAEACIVAFEGMPEAERTKLASAAVKRLRELGKGVHPRLAPLLDGEAAQFAIPAIVMDPTRLARLRAARAAVLATGSFSQWKSVKSRGLPSNERLFRILSDRRAEWLGELVEEICDAEDHLTPRWPLIRRLVREGYCGPPRSPRYIDRMLHALPNDAWSSKLALKDILLGDPGLLEHEIWRIFETEPAPGAVQLFTATMQGVTPETTWDVALIELAKEGRISRERLLDAVLDALSRDLHEMRARWFAYLHDRLDPTPAERAARKARYVDLLDSRNASTTAFALARLKELVKGDQIEAASLVDRLAPALHCRIKGTVKQALAMLELATRGSSDSALKARAVVVATEGLIHETADIQGAILDFVERHGDRHDRSLRDLLVSRRDGIVVSLHGRLDPWVGRDEEPDPSLVDGGNDLAALETGVSALDPRLAALAGVPEALAVVRGERLERPALKFDGTEIPRLDPARRLKPIEDLDTLTELCSRLIENYEPFEDIDRCVDAISRLCAERPADFAKRTAPLAARVRQLLDAPAGMANYRMHFFALVVRGWLTGEVPDPRPFDGYRALEHFLSVWAGALARRVANVQPAPLLAAPTHAGGWIDPRTLVERFRQRSRLSYADEPEDLILAILRLAPDHRATALADARDLGGEQGAAIRHALGGEGETIGPSAGLWAAAARARSPWSDDPAVEARHPGLGPDAGRAAAYLLGGKRTMRGRGSTVELDIDREPPAPEDNRGLADLPIVALHTMSWLTGNQWPSAASLWPVALESFCACGAQRLVQSSEASSDSWGLRTFLLPLFDPDVPLRPVARLLLAIALNVKLAEVAGLATDTLIAAIDDGRLGADTLGEALRIVWSWRIETWDYRPAYDSRPPVPGSVAFVKPSRWAKSLADVASASHLHARVIARAIEIFLAEEASGQRTAPSLLPFLELLREASIESGRAVSAEARAYLGGLGIAGKTGRVVAELLALQERPDTSTRRKEAIQALANRIERAERWMGWKHTVGS